MQLIRQNDLMTSHADVTDAMLNHFAGFLNDYTTDRRGDIGSLIRIEALQGASVILRKETDSATRSGRTQELIGCLTRLAAEKLDKVRFLSWLCLQDVWESRSDFPPLQRYDSALPACYISYALY